MGSKGERMKKQLVIILSLILVFGFAASAFAIHAEIPSETQSVVAKSSTQITLGGEIRVRGWYQKHIADVTAGGITYSIPVNGNANSFYDERVRLSLDAQVSPNVEGFIQLESNSASDVDKWGAVNNKKSALYILQSWILYTGSGLFGVPAGIKVGHMPLALGEKQFFDHTKFGDDAIVFFVNPTKELHIGLLTIKLLENSVSRYLSSTTDGNGGNAEDADAYVALMTYKINDQNTIGTNLTFINQSSNNDFATLAPSTLYGDNTKFYNLGFHANGKAGQFGYKGEVDIQFGHTDFGTDRSRFRGYGVMLAANYDINPVNLRSSFAYGSGDRHTDNNKISTFQTFLGADQHYTLVYEYRVSGASAVMSGSGKQSGIANTTYYNIGADFTPVKDVKTSLDFYYLKASKVPEGSDISKKAGWEVDGKVVYNVAKNLTYQVDAGYFHSSHGYQDVYDATLGDDTQRKGATVLRHALTLSF